jgi:hypothetical protein
MASEVRLLRGSCSSFGDFFFFCRGEGSGEGGGGAAGGRVQREPAPQMHSSRGADILDAQHSIYSKLICCYVRFSKFRLYHACFLNAQHSFAGRKFEHALKHGPRNGLFVVTLGWFVDCVRRNSKTISTSSSSVLVSYLSSAPLD